jgi:AcrR family transcriptional regulator
LTPSKYLFNLAAMPRPDEPRAYLRAGERRTQLLDAASALVGREGLGSLSVAGVAGEAGVSRQWVYEHFTDLDDLYRALLLDRFASLDTAIDSATRRSAGTESVTFAARQVFALVPADRRVLRALVAGAGGNRPEVEGIESELRERILRRWTGLLRSTGHDDLEARAIVWAVVNAVFGLADQIEREALAVEQAVAILERLMTAVLGPPAPGHRARRRPARSDAAHQNGTGASHAH